MRPWILLVSLVLLTHARIYNGKSRHERAAQDEFENDLRPIGESENFNPNEVISIDGQSPIRYHQTECGTFLKEIAVLQPVNSDRAQFVLKRILIEKDTGKPASGPCAEALQAQIDKEDADKPPFEPPERIDGGVYPRRDPQRNLIVDLPYMSAPQTASPYDPSDYNKDLYEMGPDPELPNLADPGLRDVLRLDPNRPSDQDLQPQHHRRNRTKSCGSKMKELVPGPKEVRRPNKCLRRDLHPLPIVVAPSPRPLCDIVRPWLNTAPCQMPPQPSTTPEYKEYNRPLDVEMPLPVAIRPPRQPRRCVHRPRNPEAIEVLPRRRGGRCRNKGERNQLPLAGGHGETHDHTGRLHHGHIHKPLEPIEGEIVNREPEFQVDDLVKRENVETIPALPVYRI